MWPLGDTKLRQRLHRITAPTLLLGGAADQIIPPGYARQFVSAIGAKASRAVVPGSGHLVEIDHPTETAAAVIAFLG